MREYKVEKSGGGSHFMRIDPHLAKEMIAGGKKRVICTVGDVRFHCAILNSKEVGYYIHLGAALLKKMKLRESDLFHAELREDDSPYQFEIPVEFAEVMASDSEANKIFESLTDGNKRSLIYLVAKLKSQDKRIQTALKIATRMKMGITSAAKILKG